MAIKHGKVVSYCEGLPPIKLHNPLNMWYHDKFKKLYFRYCNTYGHQTCQGGDILQEASTNKCE